MTYLKKLKIKGFKSFANDTEILFDKGINVVVGPNGSGKTNISDSLCFALGRLSSKSMRASKAKNLIFMGSKVMKPAKEASVEIAFDNTSKTFSLPNDEVVLKRVVRTNGQSIYKINDETKTRLEILEILAQAGISPHGFNIIQQGQIQSIVRMHPEERRKIIEEVAGISIYETRKEKSLHELEKTEERLKEIMTVLRERTAYLKNLERERAQALRYKELEETIRRSKASIISKRTEEKTKELVLLNKSIEEKTNEKDKIKSKLTALVEYIEQLNEKIRQINKHIQQSSGIEQDTLKEEISNLKAELEGLRVRKESYENRQSEISNRISQMQSSIPEYESEIVELRKKSPLMAKKQEELSKKKRELSEIEEERKNAYKIKTELLSLKDRLYDKKSHFDKLNVDSDSLLKQIEEYSVKLKYLDSDSCTKSMKKLKERMEEIKNKINSLNNDELEKTKLISSEETHLKIANKTKQQVNEIDVCPLCQTKITKEHVEHVISLSDEKINNSNKKIRQAQEELEVIIKERNKLAKEIKEYEKELLETERESSTHKIIKDKKESIKRIIENSKIIKQEIQSLEEKRNLLESKILELSLIEEKYKSKALEIEEISSRTEKDLDTTLLYKERELERTKEAIKHSRNDLKDILETIKELSYSIEEKTTSLNNKEQQEQKLTEKFKNLMKERDEMQEKMQSENYNVSTLQSSVSQIEEQINFLKIGNAKINAEISALQMELSDFSGVELIKASFQVLEEKLQKAQESIREVGAINLRALEVYDEIKDEYDKIKEKADTIEKEKIEILKIVEEIDKKKKKTFMKTFSSLNELFSRNFSQLSTKGQAYLELENKEDLFAGGITIVVRVGKGKYFDVTSLSGGEQTLVALSLLFAIQEHKPYHFYVFDEIDAALDKRNSERLSALLKQYMKSGQYIVITHNDALIMDSNVLYGVSMHEGISKIFSLNLNDSPKTQLTNEPSQIAQKQSETVQ